MGRTSGTGLIAKSRRRLAKSIIFGLCVFLCFYWFGKRVVDYLTVASEEAYLAREWLKQELETYNRQQRVAANDYASIEAFRTKHALRQIIIERHGKIILYAGERGGLFHDADYETFEIRPTMEVRFADGPAEVYFGKTDNPVLNVGISFLGAILAILAGIIYFSENTREDVDYIRKLQNEVSVISGGNFDGHVSVEGEDEIAQLARDLDRMRTELKERKVREAELRKAEANLVLGMSHDLRTPLTALNTFLEIAKRQDTEGTKYLDKALAKAEEIRTLSDEMFEHFLVSSDKENPELVLENAESAFSDYLSETCAVLTENGFSVKMQGSASLDGKIYVNYEYLGRIMNNLLSNFLKYADRTEEVVLFIDENENEILIRFENVALPTGNGRESAGIGTKNIDLMMQALGGAWTASDAEGRYVTELHFPKQSVDRAL